MMALCTTLGWPRMEFGTCRNSLVTSPQIKIIQQQLKLIGTAREPSMDAASVVEEETQLGNKHFDSLFQLVESNEPVQCNTWLCELCDNFVLATLLTEDIADLPGQMQLFGGDPSLRSAIHTIAHACRAVSIHSPSGKEARCLGAYAFEVFNRLRAEMALLNGIPGALRNYTMPKVFETFELSRKGLEGLKNAILKTITEMQADGSLDVQLGADASYWLQSCGAAQSGALSNWFGWLCCLR